jgi:predicted dinucleotide-binding enzyme
MSASHQLSDTGVGTIGILGAGRVGTAVARQALKAGYAVKIATAKPAAELALLAEIITPGAVAVESSEAVEADIVVLALPLPKFRTLDPKLFRGRVVIDAMNYWAPTDGEIDVFESDSRSSSEIVQEHLEGAFVVKTLNHIGYHDLEDHSREAGHEERRALGIAGDSVEARARVAEFVDRLGFDPIDAGPLSSGHAFQPHAEIFKGAHSAEQMRALLAAQEHLSHA